MSKWMAALAAALVACGGHSANQSELGSGPLLPLEVGNKWVYKVTDGYTMQIQSKTTSVAEFKAMDGSKAGIQAYVVRSDMGNTTSITWLEKQPEQIRRHREDSLVAGQLTEIRVVDPWSLRAPGAIPTAGQKVDDIFREDSFNPAGALTMSKPFAFQWTVDSVSEKVTVPAGEFTTVRMTRQSAGGKDKVVWWTPGVGKIKELDSNALLEELESYQLASPPSP